MTTFTNFDVVDFLLGEMEDVICNGMPTRRQMPYAHWISQLLSQIGEADAPTRGLYRDARTRFLEYRPAMRDDRRRGGRLDRAAREQVPEEELPEVEAEDAELEEAVAQLPMYFYVSSSSDSDFDEEEE